MHDNPPIYSPSTIENWFDKNGSPLVDWPQY